MQGYKQHKAFIIAQGPLKSTVRNFWKMIYDRKSAVIVMLSDLVERGKEASSQYWPSSGTYQYGEYTVELMGEEPLEGFIIRDLSVTDSKVHQVERDRERLRERERERCGISGHSQFSSIGMTRQSHVLTLEHNKVLSGRLNLHSNYNEALKL